MGKSICAVDACTDSVVGHGWCDKHYRRWKRTGDPLQVRTGGQPRKDTTPCSIEGCEGLAVAKSWCDKHYRRWKKTGDPTVVSRIIGDDHARFWSHAVRGEPEDCWLWQGSVNVPPRGTPYGTFHFENRTRGAHIVSYLLANGPGSIPARHVVDHRCSNTLCVNPNHLEAVTQRENVHRGRLLKISDARMRELSAMHASGTSLTELARLESVTTTCLRRRLSTLRAA